MSANKALTAGCHIAARCMVITNRKAPGAAKGGALAPPARRSAPHKPYRKKVTVMIKKPYASQSENCVHGALHHDVTRRWTRIDVCECGGGGGGGGRKGGGDQPFSYVESRGGTNFTKQ